MDFAVGLQRNNINLFLPFKYFYNDFYVWERLQGFIFRFLFRWARNHGSTLSEKEKRECAAARLLGTPVCPHLDDVTIIEPLVCKKIAHERLTGLEFKEDCIVTVCQEGFIVTWARPGKVNFKFMLALIAKVGRVKLA